MPFIEQQKRGGNDGKNPKHGNGRRRVCLFNAGGGAGAILRVGIGNTSDVVDAGSLGDRDRHDADNARSDSTEVTS